MRALLIEDSERLRRSLAHGLTRAGWAVDSAGDGDGAAPYVRTGRGPASTTSGATCDSYSAKFLTNMSASLPAWAS